ncbi:MAG: hypothetical protein WDA60_15850 [Acidimicrobiia bacterium]
MAEPRPIGKVYSIAPQPPDATHTRWIPAGVVTIGVEYRDVTPDALLELYGDDPDQLAELLEKSPEGGFADEGVSLHVSGTDDGHEYLRFDVFDGEPHYHYVHKVAPGGEVVNQVVDYDVAAHGEMLTWALGCIRTRLPVMLPLAGGSDLVGGLDQGALDTALAEAEPLAAAAQAAHRERV